METTDSKKRYRVPVGYCAVCKGRTMADSKGLALEHNAQPLVLGLYTGAPEPCAGVGCKVTEFKINW